MSTTTNALNPEKKARLKLRCEYRVSPYGTPYALATPYVQIFFRAWNPASVAFWVSSQILTFDLAVLAIRLLFNGVI